MNLLLKRYPTVKKTTLGNLFIDGIWECKTLEDVVREIEGVPVSAWKIQGETAIPRGRYKLSLVDSPRFGPDTLSLDSVPGFNYVRIHSGNDDADTEGCILVGHKAIAEDDDGGNLVDSRVALNNLKAKLVPVLKTGEEVWLTIS